MIIIKIVFKYGKLIGIFILLELLIAFLMGFLNLIGVKSFITSFITLVCNVAIYSGYGYVIGKNTEKKGLVAGLLIALLLTLISIIITLILFNSLSFKSLFYYLALIIITCLASTIGKNKKESSTPDKK